MPEPAHTVVVVMENHSYADIIGNRAAPFINELARRGALFTRSYAITHPSEPNYLALFSGSTQGVADDGCPEPLHRAEPGRGPDQGGQDLRRIRRGPSRPGIAGVLGRRLRTQARAVGGLRQCARLVSLPFTSFPATAFARLPSVSFVIPNLCHDMHDCSVTAGDAWLRANIGPYADWAMRHDSLLILTWDEDDGSQANHITTIFAGQMVRPGRYADPITHYSVLATIEAAYTLPRDAQAATAAPITNAWRSSVQIPPITPPTRNAGGSAPGETNGGARGAERVAH